MKSIALQIPRPGTTSDLRLLSATALAALLGPLNSTMLAVALPTVRSQFGLGVGALTWLVSAYLITVAVSQPAGGRIGDAIGHVRVIWLGLGVLAVCSVVAALTWSYPALVAARAPQGVGAALILPNVTAFLRKQVAPERLAGVLGLNGALITSGAAGGPLLGGALLALGGWRLLFLANVPLCLLAGWLLLRLEADEGAGRGALRIDAVSLFALAGAFAE